MPHIASHHLVGGFKHVLFSIIYGIVLPIDERHHFSRWLLHHQPVILGKQFAVPLVNLVPGELESWRHPAARSMAKILKLG